MTRPIVVCPLRFEERGLRQLGLERVVTLACCGPGGRAVKTWAETLAESDEPLVLAGLAGGVSSRYPAGSAAVVSEVRSAEGTSWRPTWTPSESCVVTQRDAVVRRGDERETLRERGIDLVDLESVAFARAACSRGRRWAIVRGVSDDAGSPLPAGVETWVDERGVTRPARAVAGVVARPALVPCLLRLRRHGARALREVAGLIEVLVDSR